MDHSNWMIYTVQYDLHMSYAVVIPFNYAFQHDMFLEQIRPYDQYCDQYRQCINHVMFYITTVFRAFRKQLLVDHLLDF